MTNALAVVASFVYIFAVLGVAEGLRRALKLPTDFTRKVVHIGVGMWAWGTAALFTDKWWAMIPPVAFIILNTISYRRGTFAAMETGDKANIGTILFPLAFALMIVLFFDLSPTLMAILLMPLTWGDPFAAILGRRFGRHRYHVLGSTRSVEGSIAMFLFSFFGVLVPSLFVSSSLPAFNLLLAFVLALTATAAEAVSPRGLDNVLIPASSALTFAVLWPLALGRMVI